MSKQIVLSIEEIETLKSALNGLNVSWYYDELEDYDGCYSVSEDSESEDEEQDIPYSIAMQKGFYNPPPRHDIDCKSERTPTVDLKPHNYKDLRVLNDFINYISNLPHNTHCGYNNGHCEPDEFGHCIHCCECKECIKKLEEEDSDSE